MDSLLYVINILDCGIAGLLLDRNPSMHELFLQVEKLHLAIEKAPLEISTMRLAAGAWPLIAQLETNSRVHDASALLLHHTIMLTHYRLHEWVCRSIDVSLDYPSTSWWNGLLRLIETAVQEGVPGTKYNFDSSHFLPQINPPRTFQWTVERPQRIRGSQRLLKTDVCSAVVFHWLNFPADGQHSIRSFFLNTLLALTKNPSILLLDAVWHAYNFVRPGSK
ncbi:hypothetical protein C8R41DRAFT_914764 [Lentinula lateritia]|uniref:Uncharacterized protein n=1 Tax=Lentinula lateritia TaxID=40482 RepID=A0ABQ8VU29_9AGAR|nr:hypothetical protein C8R41DRAFT_914764 [Lentinula lateritia]